MVQKVRGERCPEGAPGPGRALGTPPGAQLCLGLLRRPKFAGESVSLISSFRSVHSIQDAINAFFGFGPDGFQISAQFEEEGEGEEEEGEGAREKRRHLFTKPPVGQLIGADRQSDLRSSPQALHWTNYPRDSEVQVTFKFTFARGTVPDWSVIDCRANCKSNFGVLLKCLPEMDQNGTASTLLGLRVRVEQRDPVAGGGIGWFGRANDRFWEKVKVTLSRCSANPNVVEVSGRIDTEEAAEEEQLEKEARAGGAAEDKDGETEKPLRRVWPYLVRVFQAVLEDIDDRGTLPFSVCVGWGEE